MVASIPAVEDYETPANGATLTTGNTFASIYTGTAQTASNATAKHGTKSCHVNTTTSTTSIQAVTYPSARGDGWIEFFINIPAIGTQSYIASVTLGSQKLADIRLNADGTVSIRDLNTAVATTTISLTAGAWHRFAWHPNPAAGTQQLFIYAGVDVDAPVGSYTASLSGTCHNAPGPPVTMDEAHIGVISAAINEFYFDYFQIAATEQGSPTPTGGGGGGGGTPADFVEDFEGATSGTTVTAVNTAFTSVKNTNPTFSNTTSKSGTRSAFIDTTALADTSGMYVVLATPADSKWIEFYFRVPALGVATVIANSLNGVTKIGAVRLNASGTISLLDNATEKDVTTVTVAVNQWHRAAYLVNAAGGIQTLRLYLGADVDNPIGSFTDELNSTMSGTAQVKVSEFRIGLLTSVAFKVYYDYVQLGVSEPIPLGGSGSSSGPAIVAAPTMHLLLGMPQGDIGLGSVVSPPIMILTVKMPVPHITAGTNIVAGGTVAAPPAVLTISMPVPGLVGVPPGTVYTTPQTGTSGFRSNFPLDDVIAAITAPSTRVTRRLEIYEADNETPWSVVDGTPRLIDGSVSVDYSRDERRSLEVTLDNADGLIVHDPDGFWYDKIIKAYRGIDYDDLAIHPRILIIEDNGTRMRSFLRNTLGYPLVDINTGAASVADLYGYDIIIADSYSVTTAKAQLLKDAYVAGYQIFTSGVGNGVGEIPFVLAEIAKTTGTWQIDPALNDSPLSGGWVSTTFTGNTTSGNLPTVLDPTAVAVGTFTYSATLTIIASVAQNSAGNRWFDFHPNTPWTASSTMSLIKRGIDWLFNYQKRRTYEAKLGEFYIDKIDTPRFPRQVKVTARDGTAKLLGSKFTQAVGFSAGTDIALIVKAIANNGGIYKLLLDTGGATLTADIAFDRTTERWKAIADICAAANLEVFFNADGYLTTRPYFDPVTSPASMQFLTGPSFGNLIDWTKSSNKTRIYNRVVVTAESSAGLGQGVLFQAEAVNNEPTSPTRVDRIGDRPYFYTSSYFTSQEQCQAYADSLLRIMALEEYNLDFSSLVFPWLEVGEIMEFLDPDKGVDEPDRFLIDTLGIPLTLSPMSGNGKRVTIVGSQVSPGG